LRLRPLAKPVFSSSVIARTWTLDFPRAGIDAMSIIERPHAAAGDGGPVGRRTLLLNESLVLEIQSGLDQGRRW
jgi:hypothetical protein